MSDDARERLVSDMADDVTWATYGVPRATVEQAMGDALNAALHLPDDLIACLVESGTLRWSKQYELSDDMTSIPLLARTEGGEPR